MLRSDGDADVKWQNVRSIPVQHHLLHPTDSNEYQYNAPQIISSSQSLERINQPGTDKDAIRRNSEAQLEPPLGILSHQRLQGVPRHNIFKQKKSIPSFMIDAVMPDDQVSDVGDTTYHLPGINSLRKSYRAHTDESI
jgi:hypothetical protein